MGAQKRSAKVTTRTGDEGYTGLLGPDRVTKYDPRIEAMGDLDEATSALGLARSLLTDARLSEQVVTIQRDLYVLMAEIASPPEVVSKLRRRIGEVDVLRLDALGDALKAEVLVPPSFVLPGGTPAGAALDLSRAVVRRAERATARLVHEQMAENPDLLRYLNRLSDVVFVMARLVETRAGAEKRAGD